VIVCIVGSLILYLTWPTAGLLETDGCRPAGAIAEFSALIHGERFWRVQLVEIRRQRDEAENWDRIQAENNRRTSESIEQIDQILAQAKQLMAQTYKERADLAPSQEDQMAEQLRERAWQLNAEADDIEMKKGIRLAREKIQQQLPALRKCQSLIVEKLC
jgi:hypothetical protein